MGSRAPTRMGPANLGEVDPGEATHPWVPSVCPSRDQLEEPGRRFGLRGPWLELRDPRGSLQPEALESSSD